MSTACSGIIWLCGLFA